MELLNTNGFLFTRTALPVSVLTAPVGDGYQLPGAVIGSPLGVRGWNARIDAMTTLAEPAAVAEEYLWQFWLARKAAGDELFWVEDPKDDLYYLAEFVDAMLSFDLLCSRVYATGLQLRQRRDPQQASPVAVLPGTPAPPDWPEWGTTEWGN